MFEPGDFGAGRRGPNAFGILRGQTIAFRGDSHVRRAAKKVVEAIRSGDKAALDTLLTSEPGLLEFQAPNGSSVLLLSAYYGHGELAEVFRRHGAVPDVFEASALGDLEAVRELVGGDRGLVNSFAADGFYRWDWRHFLGIAR